MWLILFYSPDGDERVLFAWETTAELLKGVVKVGAVDDMNILTVRR